jgi:uncharacterized protein
LGLPGIRVPSAGVPRLTGSQPEGTRTIFGEAKSSSPTALALNVLVAAIGCVRFAREGLLTWRSFYPFAILGVPFSVLGGASNLPRELYQPVVGVLLLIAAVLMIRSARRAAELDLAASAEPPLLTSLLAGRALRYILAALLLTAGIRMVLA